MTWFLVVIFQITLILLGIVITAMSYELPFVIPTTLPPNNTPSIPLDNLPEISDNRPIDDEDWE
jgi:hypothetical protein